MEENREMAVPCIHRPRSWESAKRVLAFRVQYNEFERTIDCNNKSLNTTDHKQKVFTVPKEKILKHMLNPLDCEACKEVIMEYLTSVIVHPNPDAVMSDLRNQFTRYVRDGNPRPSVVVCTGKRAFAMGHLFILSREYGQVTKEEQVETMKRHEDYKLERINYHIYNYIDRHCWTDEDANNGKQEWCVNWIGARHPNSMPQHPRLCSLKLDKVVDLPSSEDGPFICPICHGPENNKNRRLLEPQKYDDNDELVALPCAHIYHESCIGLWFKDVRHNTCPQCRFQMPDAPLCFASNTHRDLVSGYLHASIYD